MKKGVWAGLAAVAAAGILFLAVPPRMLVESQVIPGFSDCPDPARSIGIVLTNRSFRTLTWETFYVGTRRKGHSTELTNEGYPNDRIIRPWQASTWCVPKPTTMWIDGASYPGMGGGVPEEDTEYFVDLVAADSR